MKNNKKFWRMNKNFFVAIGVVFVFAFGFTHVVRADDVVDIIPPTITLLGDVSVSIEQGTSYTGAGATAQDDVDGDITANIVMTGTVDTATLGVYTETYTVSDDAGNPATPVVRTITVIPVVVVAPTETIIVRNGDVLIWQGEVPLPNDGTETISDVNGNPHTVSTRSVLALVKDAETTSGAFTLSNLTYYDSFGAFYFKCITPTGGTELCDNWQYAVGSTTPWTSIDQTILTGGETIGIYFGNNHQISFSTTTISAGGTLTAIAEKYNYIDNTWSPLTGVSVGITTPNESDPWNPIVISTNPVDSNGSAVITIENPGSYNAGIVEDYYFPSYAVTVNTVPVGGGGGGGITSTTFSVPNAITYLKSVQSSDGSFGGSDLYTDWVAVAYGAGGVSDGSRNSLLSYLSSHNTLYSLVTDNERRAMALLALGQNPYSYNGINYIAAITQSFDGTQIGDVRLINDDVFGLIVLSKAGYTTSDLEISKTIEYIVNAQSVNGSWDGSVDMTAASIQALSLFPSAPGVLESITKAGTYLQNNQSGDGGWVNVSSSSWATQAMNTLNVLWTNNGKTPVHYFGGIQASDGAASLNSESLQNRIWATSYAIPAVLGKSWDAVLVGVARPSVSTGGNNTNDESDTINQIDTLVETKKVEIIELQNDAIKKEPKPEELEKETERVVNQNPMQLVFAQENKVSPVPFEDTLAQNNFESNLLTASAEGSRVPVPLFVTVGAGILALVGGFWYWFRRP